MLKQLIEFCTSDQTLFWVVVSSDVAIALAYFAIPITMAVVFRHRRDDIPYPWLWTLFVIFIVACGVTHVVHVASALTLTEYVGLQASAELVTALASVGTAIAFTFVLPQIKNLPSARQQRERLQILVAERTLEKDQLIREINHRIGNQLQVLSSLVSIESRKAITDKSLDILDRMRGQLEQMAVQHIEMSQRDYLGDVIKVDNGVITPMRSREKVA